MKKTTTLFALLGSQLLVPSAFAFSELDLSLSSDVIAMNYRLLDEQRGSQWGVGAMYNEPLDSTAVSATFNVVGEAIATREAYTGIGLKAIVHDTFQTAGSLALGGTVHYQPKDFAGFGFEGQLYFAPEILNSNDAEQYFELIARITYAVHPQAKVFVGWTDVTVDYDNAPVREVEIENAVNLGFTVSF